MNNEPIEPMNEPSKIERAVMRRVHTIHFMRPMISSGALAAVAFVAALWGIGREVWVARVFENMPRADLFALVRFFVSAFENTHLAVQLFTLLTILSAVFLARETARLLTRAFVPAHA